MLDLKKEVSWHLLKYNSVLQYRKKEIENDKQRAIMSQRVDILEMQLKEAEDRETTLKRMHHTMMTAQQQDRVDSEDAFETRIRVSTACYFTTHHLQTPREDLEKERMKRDMEELKIDHKMRVGDLER